MKINLSKEELIMINKIMGVVQDLEFKGFAPPWVSDLIESDEFLTLNEKIAECAEDSKTMP